MQHCVTGLYEFIAIYINHILSKTVTISEISHRDVIIIIYRLNINEHTSTICARKQINIRVISTSG